MQELEQYTRPCLTGRVDREINKHLDVQLLAHMTCFVARLGYTQTGQLTSRNKCFLIVSNYVHCELWPLTNDVPARLKERSVFLGKGLFKDGSWRRWVGDIHGEILAQRFVEGATPRRSRNHDQRARAVHAAADKHLSNVILAVTKLANRDPANGPLLQALHQLNSEVI